jgi:hypothetical protein
MRHFVRTTWLAIGLAGIACLFLSGCDQRELMRKMTPAEDYVLARAFVAQVVAGDMASAEKSLSAEIKADEVLKGLEGMTALFKHGEIKSFEVVGLFFRAGFGNNHSGKSTQLTVQMELSTGWFAGTVVTTVEGEMRKIAGANFEPIPDSLEKLNALNLLQSPLWAQLFLLVVVAVPLFTLYTLVLCIRTKMTRKWPWILSILLGVMTLHLNWSTGGMSFQLLGVQLLGASCFRNGLVGPWIFGVSFPLGAVLFLIKRRRLLAKESAAADASAVGPVSEAGASVQTDNE